jgi:hypothetical protein
VPNFFFRKKEGKKVRSFHHSTTILKTIFNNYDIKEFSEIGNSAKFFQNFLPRLAGSRFARENEQRLKRKSLQDFPKLISHPARKLAGEINFP